MKATIAFGLFFVFIMPKSRALVGTWLADAGTWMVAWAPLSYLVIGLAVVAPLAAALLMVKWPTVPEPENPLARYKYDDAVED